MRGSIKTHLFQVSTFCIIKLDGLDTLSTFAYDIDRSACRVGVEDKLISGLQFGMNPKRAIDLKKIEIFQPLRISIFHELTNAYERVRVDKRRVL